MMKDILSTLDGYGLYNDYALVLGNAMAIGAVHLLISS